MALESIDLLVDVSKVLYNERIVEQRKQIEDLKAKQCYIIKINDNLKGVISPKLNSIFDIYDSLNNWIKKYFLSNGEYIFTINNINIIKSTDNYIEYLINYDIQLNSYYCASNPNAVCKLTCELIDNNYEYIICDNFYKK